MSLMISPTPDALDKDPVTAPLSEARGPYWSQSIDQLFTNLRSTPKGLSSTEAARRLKQVGPNLLKKRRNVSAVGIFLNQFKSPLVLILIFAAFASIFAQDWTDALIVLFIVLVSSILSFYQEFRASSAMEKLRARLTSKITVLRDGQPRSIPVEEVVPGDLVVLTAGSLIPADGVLLQTRDFYVNQAVLTGETFPEEKQIGVVAAGAGIAARTNCVFMGTSVQSGTASALIVQTGMGTAYGEVAERLALRPPETEFEHGIRRYSNLLTEIMFALVVAIFAINVFLHKPPIDSLLFAIALAVGMTPELMPAIISITLSKGAQQMAARGVIVRRLNAIENFGSMDILCTDKTGTLTEGVVRLDDALDLNGKSSTAVMRFAYLNARFQSGLPNPLDEAILARGREMGLDTGREQKIDEIPYDFIRKRLSVVTQGGQGPCTLITKGALDNVLDICTQVREDGDLVTPLLPTRKDQINQRFAAWSGQGYRVLGLAMKTVPQEENYSRTDEQDLTFMGFLLFFDPPKPGIQKTIANLAKRGVQLKIITGDNRLVAAHVAEIVGLDARSILTGGEIHDLRDEALWQRSEGITLFAEVDPNEKERIILALRKMGHVVGYIGDGINDAPALHAADVGLSVENAVDVAKEAADFVLLRRDLDVLCQGIEEGRTTFVNTLKYVYTTTSSNFGNMISMAGASLFLPFLPLLAKQVLFQNLLSDVPMLAIAGDNIDPEQVGMPRRWDVKFIRNFMILFGWISSVFAFITFGVLILLLKTTPEQFRTGWFVESMLTELFIVMVVRTARPAFRSRPGRVFWITTATVTLITVIFPYLPFARFMGFTPLPLSIMMALLAILVPYLAVAEVAKRRFFARQLTLDSSQGRRIGYQGL